jgi:hypothetical protein
MPRTQNLAEERARGGARIPPPRVGARRGALGLLLAAVVVLAGAPGAVTAAGRAQAGPHTAGSAPDLTTIVRCDPPVVYAMTTEVATTYLYVQDVLGLNAADLWLTFNTGIGEVVDEDPYSPGVQIQPLSEFMSADFVLFRSADNTAGEIHYAATQMAKPPRDGSGRLAMVRFQPLTDGTITLQFSKLHDLSDIDGGLIPNTAQDCRVVFYEPTVIILEHFAAWPNATSIQVQWETASEIDTAGFNLWRRTSRDEGFVRLNTDLIPGQGSPIQGASYAYDDADVTTGVTYYYKLEDVDIYGRGTLHGPVHALAGASLRLYLPLVWR